MIEIYPEDSREVVNHSVKHGHDLKFVVFGQPDLDGVLVVLFLTPLNHRDAVEAVTRERQAEFVGAGSVTDGCVEWGSVSCRSSYQYDRPSSSPEATHVLSVVSEEITAYRQSLK